MLSDDTVGIHDNHFELRGASIGSLRIIARAADAGLSIDPELLRPALLFEHPTIAQLAALVGSAEATRIDAAGRREE